MSFPMTCSAGQSAANRGSGVRGEWIVTGSETDVIHQRIEPDERHEPGIERDLDAPGKPRLGPRDAQVAFDLLHGIAQFRDTEIRDDQRLALRAPSFDQIEEPLLVAEQPEVVVLLLAKLDLAPFRAELAVRPALFVREELLLAHAVISAP